MNMEITRRLIARVGIPQSALFVEFCTLLALGIVILYGGWMSTPNILYRVFKVFVSLLSGWGFMCSLLAAIFWRRCFHKLQPALMPKRVSRFHNHRRHVVVIIVCFSPVALDVITSIVLVFHVPISVMAPTNAGILTIAQVACGIYSIFQTVRFTREVRSLQCKRLRQHCTVPTSSIIHPITIAHLSCSELRCVFATFDVLDQDEWLCHDFLCHHIVFWRWILDLLSAGVDNVLECGLFTSNCQ